MARPLRQFYGEDRTLDLVGAPSPAAPYRRHRQRFLEALAGLTDDEWSATTRCDAWNVKDVCNHLVSADGYWAMTIAARHHDEPTTFLRGFDPTQTPEQIIAPVRDRPSKDVLDALTQSTDVLLAAIDDVADDEWALLTESPFGHVPVRVITAHALWDSWLHERDVLLPLDRTPAVEEDELVVSAAFTLFLGAGQGGVLDDATPVGPGPETPIEATVAFDDLPGHAFAVDVGRNAVVTAVDGSRGTPPSAGSAVEFVEAITGRTPAGAALDRLPADLAAQLDRARQIL